MRNFKLVAELTDLVNKIVELVMWSDQIRLEGYSRNNTIRYGKKNFAHRRLRDHRYEYGLCRDVNVPFRVLQLIQMDKLKSC